MLHCDDICYGTDVLTFRLFFISAELVNQYATYLAFKCSRATKSAEELLAHVAVVETFFLKIFEPMP
jgi:hypothetical protein